MQLALTFGLLALMCPRPSLGQDRRFPEDFIFGTATAAYQIEGAWNVDGKGENIWDYLTHTQPDHISDLSNGDIAANSYFNYRRDVEMMRELGLDAYRFSLSWARILPEGFSNNVNEAGVQFYNNYIDEMLKYNIQPMITLYHWDLPQKLQELGGLANPLFSEWFEDYARVVFDRFSDRVKFWITFNEPRETCEDGYGMDIVAPVVNATGVGTYLCAKNLVVAHAKAYHVYNNEFKPTRGGKCGITISVNSYEPATVEDEEAAEIRRQAAWGLYADPIFSSEGGFPKELSKNAASKSAEQNYPRSRLPSFTEEERVLVRGSFDFFGVNHYTSYLVSATGPVTEYVVPSVLDDAGVFTFVPDEWPKAMSSWLQLAPNSLYNALTHLGRKYGDIEFYVTENGWSIGTVGLNDDERVRYYRAALEDVIDVLAAGVNLRGYMAWSLMDNFEWFNGYTERFGLYEVDFDSPERTRTARKSALVYKHIIKHRFIDHDYEPDNLTMTIDDGH